MTPPIPPHTSFRILVVDDNPEIHADFRKVLSVEKAKNPLDILDQEFFGDQKGQSTAAPSFIIDTALQGQEALSMVEQALAEKKPYCVVFVDVRMPPGWDGIETLDRIWQVDSAIQGVICTAFSDYSWTDIRSRFSSAADRLLVLKKPFESIELRQMAYALGEKWRLAREEQRVLAALSESEQRLAITLHSIGDAVISTDMNGCVERMNPEAERLTGWPIHEACGRSMQEVFQIINEQSRCRVESPVDRVLAEGCVVGLANHTLLIHRNGAETPIADSAAPICGEDKSVQGVVLVFRDQSAEVAAQRALEASEERYRNLLHALDLGVAVFDQKGDLIMDNCYPKQDDPGGSARSFLSSSVYQAFCLQEKQDSDSRTQHLLKGAEAFEQEFLDRSVSSLPVLMRLRRIPRYQEGQIDGYIDLIEDISVRHRMDEQLRQSQKMEAVGRLTGGIAHDFNNMLTALLGHADRALVGVDSGSTFAQHLHQVIACAERGAKLTKELLAFSRQRFAEPKRVDVASLLYGLEETLRRLLHATIHLECDVQESLPAVLIDPNHLEQALVNLVINAGDAMPDGGTIHISARLASCNEGYCPGSCSKLSLPALGKDRKSVPQTVRQVLIRVSDTGHGIPEQLQTSIFDPFFTTKKMGEGTGLGLSTAHGLIRQAGGNLLLDAKHHPGASFVICLPVKDLPVEEEAARLPSVTRRSASLSVLLVDDESFLVELWQLSLSEAGHRVRSAEDGQQASEIIEEDPDAIDLLITDLVMPRMGGIDLARFLRDKRPDIPIIFCSGYSSDIAGIPKDIAQPYAMLSKPFRNDELMQCIGELFPT